MVFERLVFLLHHLYVFCLMFFCFLWCFLEVFYGLIFLLFFVKCLFFPDLFLREFPMVLLLVVVF